MKKLFISSVLSVGFVFLAGCATSKPQSQCDGKSVKCPHQQDGCCPKVEKKHCPLGF